MQESKEQQGKEQLHKAIQRLWPQVSNPKGYIRIPFTHAGASGRPSTTFQSRRIRAKIHGDSILPGPGAGSHPMPARRASSTPGNTKIPRRGPRTAPPSNKPLGLKAISRFSAAVSTAVVTGAGSGIGRAIAGELARQGHEIVIVEIDEKAGRASSEAIREAGGRARLVPCDLAQTESVREAYNQIEAIDILINNAGIASVGNVEECTPGELDRVYDVNVKGMYHSLHFAIPKLIAAGGGSVVNLASIASYLGISDRFAYSMSKGAVLSMTMSIARDYIDKGIRCNCVCPGRVHTPFVDGYLAKNYPEHERDTMFRTLSEFQPIGRMGTPGEIAGLVAYLVSSQAAFITGSAFEIDGGVTNLR